MGGQIAIPHPPAPAQRRGRNDLKPYLAANAAKHGFKSCFHPFGRGREGEKLPLKEEPGAGKTGTLPVFSLGSIFRAEKPCAGKPAQGFSALTRSIVSHLESGLGQAAVVVAAAVGRVRDPGRCPGWGYHLG